MTTNRKIAAATVAVAAAAIGVAGLNAEAPVEEAPAPAPVEEVTETPAPVEEVAPVEEAPVEELPAEVADPAAPAPVETPEPVEVAVPTQEQRQADAVREQAEAKLNQAHGLDITEGSAYAPVPAPHDSMNMTEDDWANHVEGNNPGVTYGSGATNPAPAGW